MSTVEEAPSRAGDDPDVPMWAGRRLPRTFAALRHRNFRLFYFGQFFSLIGTWMQNTAQGWLVVMLATMHHGGDTALGASASGAAEATANLYLGILSVAASLPVLLGSIYGGMVADRHSRRGIILLTQTLQMVLALAMAGLVYFELVRIWHVVLMALCAGTVNAFDVPARQSFVVDMVGKEDLGNAIALNSSIFNGARAIGPAVTGLLIASLQRFGQHEAMGLCFLFNGLSFAAVLWGLLLMRGDFSPREATHRPPREQLREVWQYMQGHQAVRVLILMVATFSVFVAPYFILLPSIARYTLHADVRGFGFLMSCGGIGALAGALTMATLSNYGRKGRILTGASLLFPLLLVALSVSRVYWLSCLIVAGNGFLFISFLATANTMLQTSVPDELRGRIMGVYALILMGLSPVGGLWAGLVARAAGAPVAIATGAVVMGLAGLFVFIRLPRFRSMRRTLPETL